MNKKSQRNLKFNTTSRTEFNPDYTPVKRDLRRIGLLAGIFLAILVILSFFQDSIMALFIK
ncbi:MAG: hypothetical protein FJZ96_08945 [Chloroflexi bacterium]|nr:hypothetical protein [Chloroflexota bacterium]